MTDATPDSGLPVTDAARPAFPVANEGNPILPVPDAARPAETLDTAALERAALGHLPVEDRQATAAVPVREAPSRGLAPWALVVSIIGLVGSLFVGWGFPVGVVAVASASMALRRPEESRLMAGWALALGILSLIYSAMWLIWAATSSNLFA